MFPPKLFLCTVIRPVLSSLGSVDPRLNSVAAEQLLLGTALAESGLAAVSQRGGGPARGFFQIEPATANDVFERWLQVQRKRALEDIVHRLRVLPGREKPIDELYGNPFFGCALARLKYWMSPDPLPSAGDWPDIAAYWKQHYNPPAGAGTHEHFLRAVSSVQGLWDFNEETENVRA